MARLIAYSFAPLLAFAAITALVFSGYLSMGVTPSDNLQAIMAVMWSLLLPTWVLADAHRRQSLPYDFGFFCYVFMPIIVPAYCFWSRGWRGAITLATLLAIWFTPYLVATIVWTFLYGGQ
jgi:hypothetical protein